MKRFLGILLAISSLFSVSVIAAGVNPEASKIMPCYEYVRKATASLDISDGVADVSAEVAGYPGTTTKVYITMYLEQKVNGTWKTVESWTDGVTSYGLTLEESTDVDSGYTYRVRASCQVYAGTSYELITEYSDEVQFG